MLPTILQPRGVAERCYLGEALDWMTLGRLPLAYVGDREDEARVEIDYFDGLIAKLEYEVAPITDDECDVAGIPHNPEYEAYIDPRDPTAVLWRSRAKGAQISPKFERR